MNLMYLIRSIFYVKNDEPFRRETVIDLNFNSDELRWILVPLVKFNGPVVKMSEACRKSRCLCLAENGPKWFVPGFLGTKCPRSAQISRAVFIHAMQRQLLSGAN